ncbi:MAG TPA: hypothetical protein H9867_07765 [Candidatus Corynebacterium gallistercoris]|uniref:Uncharacterized protein n=1 Tax=Candidatus Corynebacterium gallistercoris TaxID=2838530 RepID=A0A9D1URI9_9CORY|nr:hypothetical protein [Candidatus Corynebacterium gallistercoris]
MSEAKGENSRAENEAGKSTAENEASRWLDALGQGLLGGFFYMLVKWGFDQWRGETEPFLAYLTSGVLFGVFLALVSYLFDRFVPSVRTGRPKDE